MYLKEVRDLANKAKYDIEHILDDFFDRTGIDITDVKVSALDTTHYEADSNKLKHLVTLSASMDF